MMEKVKVGKKYDIEWVDGDVRTRCTFVREHKNFFIFLDENGMRVICRSASIKSIREIN